MESRLTKPKSYSPLLHRCVVTLLGVTRTVVSLCVGLALCSPVLAASELPPANDVLRELQISDHDRQQIREGNIVTWSATEGSDRELAIGMALLVKTSAENLVELFREPTAFKAESAIITAYGRFAGDARTSRQHVFARDELSLATKQSKLIAKYLPSVSDVLLHYPATKSKEGEEFEEQFFWMNVEVSGRPTYVLSHRMHFRIGEASIVVDRHFYASHVYNSLQQGVAALPTKDGMVVTYLGRVSTDQVTGFGSSAKRPVARALMGSHIKDMLEALRAKAEKP